MKIKLDIEDRLVFGTVRNPHLCARTLLVRVNGKAFSVWRSIDPMETYMADERYLQETDRMLVASMEAMFTKIFKDACAAVPMGVDLLENREG